MDIARKVAQAAASVSGIRVLLTSSKWLLTLVVGVAPACGRTSLEVRRKSPADPDARTTPLPRRSSVLRPNYDPDAEPAAVREAEHSQHEHPEPVQPAAPAHRHGGEHK